MSPNLDGPASTLAYPTHSPGAGTYDANMPLAEEKVDAGVLYGTVSDYVSQQQLAGATTRSYCEQTYGRGWRLPTPAETGNTSDDHGTVVSTELGYALSMPRDLWTSGRVYFQNQWRVWYLNDSDGMFHKHYPYTLFYARCVYPGY